MGRSQGVFVPHDECTVASGDCFRLGKCIGSCKSAMKRGHEARIRELEETVSRLTNTTPTEDGDA